MKQPATTNNFTQNFNFKCWKYTLALAVLFFSPYIFNFIWGNHDWQWIKEYTPLWSGLFEGRFSTFILQTIIFSGNVLPILTLITSLALFATSTIMLLNLWHTPHKNWIYIILSLNLISSPYTLSWLYFAFNTLCCLSWSLFIIAGYFLLEDFAHKQHPIACFITAAIFFLLALGGYPPVINLISVIFFTLILYSLSFLKESIKTITKKYFLHIIAILLSAILLLFIQYLLKKYNLQFSTYNTAGINLSNIHEKIILSTKAAIEQFFISLSFISFPYKLTYFFLFLLALLELYLRLPKTLTTLLLFILSVIGLILSPIITLFLAENTPYVLNEPRIAFFGLTYIYMFSVAVLLRSHSTITRNITFIALIIILAHNFHTIAYAAKVWISGFKAETNFSERFISRLEENPNFSTKQKYTFIQGGNLDFRGRYYIPDNTKTDSYTLSAPFIPWHLPSKAYMFYYPINFINNDFDTYWQYINPLQINITDKLEHYILYKAEAWPKPNAVYLDNSTIILIQTPTGKYAGRGWMEYINQIYPH